MIFITYLVPPTLLFIPLGDVVKAFGIGDTPWAVILTYPTFLIPFCTWLLMGYFKTIPREIEDCARIDGASRIQAMVRISFPLAVPGILSAGIFALHPVVERVPLRARSFSRRPSKKTIPIGVFTELVRGDVFYWGPLMAGRSSGLDPGRARLLRSSSSTTSPLLRAPSRGSCGSAKHPVAVIPTGISGAAMGRRVIRTVTQDVTHRRTSTHADWRRYAQVTSISNLENAWPIEPSAARTLTES